MTEDEAKTIRCCGPKGAGVFVDSHCDGTPIYHCIGSACMAWRWSMTVDDKGKIRDRDEGFCGLAGEP